MKNKLLVVSLCCFASFSLIGCNAIADMIPYYKTYTLQELKDKAVDMSNDYTKCTTNTKLDDLYNNENDEEYKNEKYVLKDGVWVDEEGSDNKSGSDKFIDTDLYKTLTGMTDEGNFTFKGNGQRYSIEGTSTSEIFGTEMVTKYKGIYNNKGAMIKCDITFRSANEANAAGLKMVINFKFSS